MQQDYVSAALARLFGAAWIACCLKIKLKAGSLRGLNVCCLDVCININISPSAWFIAKEGWGIAPPHLPPIATFFPDTLSQPVCVSCRHVQPQDSLLITAIVLALTKRGGSFDLGFFFFFPKRQTFLFSDILIIAPLVKLSRTLLLYLSKPFESSFLLSVIATLHLCIRRGGWRDVAVLMSTTFWALKLKCVDMAVIPPCSHRLSLNWVQSCNKSISAKKKIKHLFGFSLMF